MFPAKPGLQTKNGKGGILGRISFNELLKKNEQIRTASVK